MPARWLRILSLVAITFVLTLAACSKKTAVAKSVPPPPPPAAPTATITASPDSVERGQPVMLTWNADNATDISISGVGEVVQRGSQTIIPQSSTTYILTAKGPGGSKDASARVTVSLPPPTASKASPTDEELFSQNVQDVFFDYDRYAVTSQQETAVEHDAKFLNAHPYWKLMISGHCDERGSEEYNLTLGDSRADTVRDQLERLGVKPDRIRTISYGKEKPFCSDDTEACWHLNRRAHFSLQP
ncbi:MAG TPA: OmpA family protein [Candidatus Angelobacter sp.]|nr:OmpA family protein [Candidatus Angelobacter sp.]